MVEPEVSNLMIGVRFSVPAQVAVIFITPHLLRAKSCDICQHVTEVNKKPNTTSF